MQRSKLSGIRIRGILGPVLRGTTAQHLVSPRQQRPFKNGLGQPFDCGMGRSGGDRIAATARKNKVAQCGHRGRHSVC